MKKSRFIINVWDLLLSAGKTDKVSFEKEQIDELQDLASGGISGTVVIQSFDQNSLLVTIEDLHCVLHEQCDRCMEFYDREVFVKDYVAKFQTEISDEDYESDEEVFLIDKNENIDIKDMIINSIKLQEPFTKKCDSCAKLPDDEDENDDIWVFEWTWNINFR